MCYNKAIKTGPAEVFPYAGISKTQGEKGAWSMMFVRSLSNVAVVIVLLILSLCLTGCFSSHPKDIEAYLKPYQTQVTAEKYVLQPPDEIEIHCARIPEINAQRQRIRPDGKVSFENIGEFMAAGRTPEELALDMRQKLSTLYMLVGEEPIEVRIIAFRSKAYHVLGQVLSPGPKLYTGRDSVMSALSEAQPTPLAWLGRIQVIRPSSDKTVKAKIFEVNFDRMSAHGELDKNVLLQEGDVIYVPPTVLAALAMKIEEFIRPIARAFSGVNIMQSGGAYGTNSNVSGY
jgi:polysaccharide export outer membrane protein